ncbi:MAG: hypothetical protein U0836_11310 [Pirellulales bacterium]
MLRLSFLALLTSACILTGRGITAAGGITARGYLEGRMEKGVPVTPEFEGLGEFIGDAESPAFVTRASLAVRNDWHIRLSASVDVPSGFIPELAEASAYISIDRRGQLTGPAPFPKTLNLQGKLAGLISVGKYGSLHEGDIKFGDFQLDSDLLFVESGLYPLSINLSQAVAVSEDGSFPISYRLRSEAYGREGLTAGFFQNSLELTDVLMPDGATPESRGYTVGFEDGAKSPNEGYLFITGEKSNDVKEYTLEGKFVRDFVPSGSGGLYHPQGAQFGPDGLLYVCDQTSVKRFDGDTGEYVDTFASGFNTAGDIVFDSHGNAIVSDQVDRSVKEYSPTGDLLHSYDLGAQTWGLHLLSDDRLLVVLTVDGDQRNTAGVLNLTTGEVTAHTSNLHEPFGVAEGPDGRFYFANYTFAAGYGGSDPDTIYVVGPEGGQAARWNTVPNDLFGANSLLFADSTMFVTSYYNDKVVMFDVATGQELGSFDSAAGPAGIAFLATPAPGDANRLCRKPRAGGGLLAGV